MIKRNPHWLLRVTFENSFNESFAVTQHIISLIINDMSEETWTIKAIQVMLIQRPSSLQYVHINSQHYLSAISQPFMDN